jgi:hypothetical protein
MAQAEAVTAGQAARDMLRSIELKMQAEAVALEGPHSLAIRQAMRDIDLDRARMAQVEAAVMPKVSAIYSAVSN